MLKNSSLVQSSISQADFRLIKALTSGNTIGFLAKERPAQFEKKFKDIIALIGTISGIKDTPDELTEGLLLDYFKTRLQGFTFDDFRLAFTMNAAGEFGQRVDHFNLLDIKFVSQVMDLYLEQKIAVSRRIKALLPPPDDKIITPDESYAGLVGYVKKHGTFPLTWSWNLAYQYMEEMLMITESLEDKNKLYDDVYHRINNSVQLKILSMRDTIERGQLLESIPEQVKTECRKILIKKYLDSNG